MAWIYSEIQSIYARDWSIYRHETLSDNWSQMRMSRNNPRKCKCCQFFLPCVLFSRNWAVKIRNARIASKVMRQISTSSGKVIGDRDVRLGRPTKKRHYKTIPSLTITGDTNGHGLYENDAKIKPHLKWENPSIEIWEDGPLTSFPYEKRVGYHTTPGEYYTCRLIDLNPRLQTVWVSFFEKQSLKITKPT